MINVYDFDNTIYYGDSTRDFYFFCLKRHLGIIRYLPYQFFWFCLYVFDFISKTRFKEKFYVFFKGVDDIDSEVKAFWTSHEKNIKKWYKGQKRKDDIIISASPEFLLKPICAGLGVRVIASRVDKYTGKYDGENCYGDEKVLRLRTQTQEDINKFFSDSLSDAPLALLAQEAYIVEGDTLIPWKNYKKRNAEALFSKQFLAFAVVGGINAFNGVLFSYLFSLLLNANAAFVCGYILSLTIGYILNSRFVFKERPALKKYLKYALSYIPNFLIQNVCVITLYNLAGAGKIAAYIAAAVIGVPLTFIILKLFAFRNQSSE